MSDQDRVEATAAERALQKAFAGVVHNQDDGEWAAEKALSVLRSLPLDQRMEAMGMERVAVWAEGLQVVVEADPDGVFWVEGA